MIRTELDPTSKTIPYPLLLVVVILLAWGFYVFADQEHTSDFKFWSFYDESNISLDQLLSIPNEDWVPFKGNIRESVFTQDEFWRGASDPIVWVKIQVPRRIPHDNLWLELVPNVGIDGMLLQRNEGNWTWRQAEGKPGTAEQQLPVNYLTFRLDTQNDYKIAYIKLNTSQIFHFSINVMDFATLTWSSILRNVFSAMILGALVLAFCYNLAIGASAGERIYVIYAAYIASMFCYILVFTGYLRIMLPEWGGQGVVARSAVYITLYTAILFLREIFSTKQDNPVVDVIVRVALAVILISLFTSLFIHDFYAFLINDLVALSAQIVALYAGINALRNGHPLAKFYLLAWTFYLAGGMIWTILWLGAIDPTLTASNLLLIGTAIEVGLLSLVLAYRYSFLKQQTELLAAQHKKFQNLSETDELTGLLNRRGFQIAVDKELATSDAELYWLSIDIDHFKRFNDQYGHLAGDRLLAEFGSKLLIRSKREELAAKLVVTDSGQSYRRSIIGRVGGEEFAILLVNTNIGQARLYAERILREFEDIRVRDNHGDTVGSTLSIGGAAVIASLPIEEVWKFADKNLYQAKNSGRNQTVIS
jgi:diguanylate cyclase (GGDEF)-like protein